MSLTVQRLKSSPFVELLDDFLFPRDCFYCGRPLKNSKLPHVCETCSEKIYLIKEPFCQKCGFPLFGNLNRSPESCNRCETYSKRLKATRSLFLHRDVGGSFVHELKYRMGNFLDKDMQMLIRVAPWAEAYLSEKVLVPVPLSVSRLRQRGYNQSDLICKAITNTFETKGVSQLLKRTAKTTSQTGLSRSERKENVKGAFALNPRESLPKGSQIVLIDDVLTTGATLEGCAKVLWKHGYREISAFTLAHG